MINTTQGAVGPLPLTCVAMAIALNISLISQILRAKYTLPFPQASRALYHHHTTRLQRKLAKAKVCATYSRSMLSLR